MVEHETVTVGGVSIDANRFNDGTNTCFYSSTDTFQLGSVAITFEQFEGLLANDQTMSGSYNPNGASSFNITNANVQSVETISAEATGNNVAVTYTRPAGNGAGTTVREGRRVRCSGRASCGIRGEP